MEDQFLSCPPTQHVGKLVEHFTARGGVFLLIGKHHRVTQRATARHDRDLVHRIRPGQRRGNQRMTTLVIGGNGFLVIVHHSGALLGAGNNPVDGFIECIIVDYLTTRAGRQQRGLIQHIGQICAGESGCAASH